MGFLFLFLSFLVRAEVSSKMGLFHLPLCFFHSEKYLCISLLELLLEKATETAQLLVDP